MGENNIEEKTKILVIEDNKENQRYLELILHKNYELDFCDSADNFYELISRKKYEVIIMDITLSGSKSGISLIKEIKQSSENKNIPVLVLSAHVFSQDKKKAIDAGADVYLTKPVENKKLIDTLTKITATK